MIDKERITRQFVKLVSIDAPSYREREMADYLTKELEECIGDGGLQSNLDKEDIVYIYEKNRGYGFI